MAQAGGGAGGWLSSHWKIVAAIIAALLALILLIVLLVVLIKGSVPCEDGNAPVIEAVVFPEGVAPTLCIVNVGSQNVTLTGDHFYRHRLSEDDEWDDPVVKIGDKEVPSVPLECTEESVHNRYVEKCTQLNVQLLQGTFIDELINAKIEVTNPEPCGNSGELENAITINRKSDCDCGDLIVFFADPPATYTQVDLTVTVFSTAKTLLQVKAVPKSGGTEFNLDGEACVGTGATDAERCSKIQGTVPAGKVPGLYTLKLESAEGDSCDGPDFTVKGTAELRLSTVSPTNIKSGTATAVKISRDSATSVAFKNLPRVYVSGGPNGNDATALEAVTFGSGEEITAVTPANLGLGTYDLIVVNPGPGFEVASKLGAFVVQDVSPPEIDFASPYGVLLEADGKKVQLRGRNLVPNATVTLRCINYSPSPKIVNTTVVFVSENQVEITIVNPTDKLVEKDHCLIDYVSSTGSFTFSSIYILGAAANLADFTAGPALVHSRYRHAVRSVRPTAASKHLVAIGGTTDGTSGLVTVESASISERGLLSSWRVQRNRLPVGLHGHRVERVSQYLYSMGGTKNGTESTSVYRAHVLDPLATPTITDIGVEYDATATGQLMPAGLWYYRVAATFPSTHGPNPDGETLPSDAAVLDLPAYEGLSVVLKWSAVFGANGYRVYRSPMSGADVDSLEFLASTPETQRTYSDNHATATSGGPCTTSEPGPACPLRVGDVGVWHTLTGAGAVLLTARTALLSAVIPPPASGTDYLLFVMGGRAESGADATILATTEYASITVTPKLASDATTSETQSFAVGWTAGQNLASALSDTTAYVFSAADSLPFPGYQVADNEFYIYTGVGRSTGGKKTTPMVNSVAITGGNVTTANSLWEDMTSASQSSDPGMCLSAYTGRIQFSGRKISGYLETYRSVSNWNAGLSDVIVRSDFDCVKESGFTFNVGGVVLGTTVALNGTSSTLA